MKAGLKWRSPSDCPSIFQLIAIPIPVVHMLCHKHLLWTLPFRFIKRSAFLRLSLHWTVNEGSVARVRAPRGELNPHHTNEGSWHKMQKPKISTNTALLIVLCKASSVMAHITGSYRWALWSNWAQGGLRCPSRCKRLCAAVYLVASPLVEGGTEN